jgi:hypothetical protein
MQPIMAINDINTYLAFSSSAVLQERFLAVISIPGNQRMTLEVFIINISV